MLSRLSRVLNEPVMGFLALTALSLGVAPLLFQFPRGLVQGFDVANWLVIGLFALEYSVHFFLAADRRKFMTDPWRVLDLVIIGVPFLTLLPVVSNSVTSTPVLRILRLLRVLLFGPRIEHGLTTPGTPVHHAVPVGPVQVSVLGPGEQMPRQSDWDSLLRWAAAPTPEWVHACNLPPESLMAIAAAMGVPHLMVEAALQESSFPRIETGPVWTALTVSLPSVGDVHHRDPVLLLVSEHSMLSLSPHPLHLQQVPAQSEDLPWGPRCVLHIVRLVLARDEELVASLEHLVRQIEALPVIVSSEGFFRQTFGLKRVLSTAKGDLWRLHGLLDMLAQSRRILPGLGPNQRESIAQLTDEADYLYETVDNVRESVLSLIELHLDVAARDTNRFMRLLAIVTTLALIPAVIGGLLGMNLGEGPFPVTLGQVSFGTLVLTLGVLYVFMAKGWLR